MPFIIFSSLFLLGVGCEVRRGQVQPDFLGDAGFPECMVHPEKAPVGNPTDPSVIVPLRTLQVSCSWAALAFPGAVVLASFFWKMAVQTFPFLGTKERLWGHTLDSDTTYLPRSFGHII